MPVTSSRRRRSCPGPCSSQSVLPALAAAAPGRTGSRVAFGEQHRRPHALEDPRAALRRILGIEKHIGRAEPQAREQQPIRHAALGQLQRDDVAAPDPACRERAPRNVRPVP